MGDQQVYTLSYSVRGRVVLKYFGQLCNVLAALTFVTLAVSLIFGEFTFAIRYAVVISFVALLGIFLSRLSAPSNIQPNEALVITAFIFIFTSLILSFPMMSSGLSFEDALFEAVSAVTTTGLSTLTTVEDTPRTFLFARAWMQWFGGLGIVVLSVTLLIPPGVAAKRLVDIEKAEDFIGGTRLYALRVLKIYLILTLLGVLLLALLGAGSFTAVVHALAAVSTGGFSSLNNSLAGLESWVIQTAVMIISLSGAISLILYYRAFRQGWRKFVSDVEVRALIISALATSFLLAVFMSFVGNIDWGDILRHVPLLALSAQTTTGFSTFDVSELDPASKLVVILSMTIGGSIGSTAGGMKILRILIALKMLKLIIVQTCLPEHAVVEPRLSGQRIESAELERALLVILLFSFLIIVSWLPFVAMGYNPLDALFEVVSATGTVGLSSGIIGPDLPSFLKGVLCADMLMGRLEIIALLVTLYPRTWFGRRVESK